MRLPEVRRNWQRGGRGRHGIVWKVIGVRIGSQGRMAERERSEEEHLADDFHP
jgi:hypothetical protein